MFLDTPEELLGKVKHCPKCYTRIEKISGCNDMVCGNRHRGYRFCWLCLQGRDVHRPFTCNYHRGLLWDRNKSLKTQFHFYYEDYRNQMASLNQEIELTKQIETSLEPGNVKSRSTRAGDILVESRRTLVSSFIFAAILAENNESLLLHSNQNELQRAAEELSRFLQTIPESVALIDVDRMKRLASYCKSRCAIVTEQILDGYERNAWEYLDPN